MHDFEDDECIITSGDTILTIMILKDITSPFIGTLTQMDLQQIVALSSLISSSVQQITSLTKLEEKSYTVSDSRVCKQILKITATVSQLISLVRTPEQYVLEASIAFSISSSLNCAVESSVVEIIREKGHGSKHSLHAKEISIYNNVDDHKLARILRLLATHHIFDEVSPNTFANNRLSTVLDTDKSIAEIQARHDERYDGTSGIAALVGLVAAFMSQILLDSTPPSSSTLPRIPFCRSRNTKLTIFEWWNLPENKSKMKRFGNAMNGTSRTISSDALLRGFDWRTLPSGSVVVDVGGGVGAASLPIVQACPNIRLVIQDRAPIILEAEKFWKSNYQEALDEERVSFQVQDFLLAQTSSLENTAIVLVRLVLHNWPDSECLVILRNLCAAASPDTKLVLVDNSIMYACRDDLSNEEDGDNTNGERKGGANKVEAPEPLLANWGATNMLAYELDIVMMCNHDGSERTLAEVDSLLSQSGWAVQEVHQFDKSWLPQTIAVPASVGFNCEMTSESRLSSTDDGSTIWSPIMRLSVDLDVQDKHKQLSEEIAIKQNAISPN